MGKGVVGLKIVELFFGIDALEQLKVRPEKKRKLSIYPFLSITLDDMHISLNEMFHLSD